MNTIATLTKIKINDAIAFRKELDLLYETANQVVLAKWSLKLAKHILNLVEYDVGSIVLEGFLVNEAWQKGEARMHDARQAGFKVHSLAKSETNIIYQTALRVAGQAIGTGHMKEHAMVASDYAIKTINLLRPDDMSFVIKERQWQINTLEIEIREHT